MQFKGLSADGNNGMPFDYQFNGRCLLIPLLRNSFPMNSRITAVDGTSSKDLNAAYESETSRCQMDSFRLNITIDTGFVT